MNRQPQSAIVDLSLTLRNGMRGVTMETHTTIAVQGYNTSMLHLYSHAGTHMDAPRHFVPDGNTIDTMSLATCVGQALVVNLSHVTPNSQIFVADLAPSATRIEPGTRLLLRTDWDIQADRDEYRTEMPRISPELAHWLVARGVILLGLETPSVASLRPEMRAELTEVHQILLKAGVVIVESLANLRMLQNDVVTFVALPLKLDARDGSPVRAIALDGTEPFNGG